MGCAGDVAQGDDSCGGSEDGFCVPQYLLGKEVGADARDDDLQGLEETVLHTPDTFVYACACTGLYFLHVLPITHIYQFSRVR